MKGSRAKYRTMDDRNSVEVSEIKEVRGRGETEEGSEARDSMHK